MTQRAKDFSSFLHDNIHHFPFDIFQTNEDLEQFFYVLYSLFAYEYCQKGSVSEQDLRKHFSAIREMLFLCKTFCYTTYKCAELKILTGESFPYKISTHISDLTFSDSALAITLGFQALCGHDQMPVVLNYMESLLRHELTSKSEE